MQLDKDRQACLIPEPLSVNIRTCVEGVAPWPLFVHGPPGTGKTCAALVLLDHAGGSYFTARDLAQYLIRAQQGRLVTPRNGWTVHEEDVWRDLSRNSLVVLDELASQDRVSSHHYECVKKLLDIREGKPLVVLSNLGLERIEELYDDRVASRLAAGTVVALAGRDRRLPEPRKGGQASGESP